MGKILVAATLILLSCMCISLVASLSARVISYAQSSTAFAQIYIEHSSVSDLVVDLGVGEPLEPDWSMNIWNRASSINNLNLTVDISAAVQYLPPSEKDRWFLRVFDAVNGNQGQIKRFTITFGNQTFDSTAIPVAIYDLQASCSYIPGVPLELAISRRLSIRDFPDAENYTVPEVSWELLSKVLGAGYGLSSWGRTVPSICGNFPLVIYVCNKTAVYKYDPEGQSLNVWKYGDYRFSDQPYPGFPYPGPGAHPAPIELFIALDTGKFADINLGAMEAGAVEQNIYLEANALGLGTVCVGGVNQTLVQETLGLPSNETILYNMPLGYSTTDAFYNYTCVQPPASAELPQVEQSSTFLDYTLMESGASHVWSQATITLQETSQLLWAAYGSSFLEDMRPSFWSYMYQHRTVASPGYCLTIWMLNSSGVYVYDPSDHQIFMELVGDKRAEIAQSTEAPWIASAPMVLLAVVNSSQVADGRLDWAYTEIGSVIQNVHLESCSWGLVADCSKIVDENATSATLGITQYTDLHPIIAITVGHPLEYQHEVLQNGNTYLVTVSTNSTVTNFKFDNSTNTESYEVEGVNGPVGYSNVTIPKSLLNGNLTVLIDGITTYYSLTQNATHSILYFTYNNTGYMVGATVIITEASHDVAVTSLTPNKIIVGKGYVGNVPLTCNISAVIANQGTYAETFNVAVSANTTRITMIANVNLTARNSTVQTVVWNVSSFSYGNYTLQAVAGVVPGETDTADNTFTYVVPVHVGVPGDVSSLTPGVYDGKVDMRDIAYLVAKFNTRPGKAGWDANADINNDGICNMRDIAIAIVNFNKHE